MMSYQQLLEEEKNLGEAEWDQITAVEFGEHLKKKATEKNLAVAIAIFFNSQRVYHVGLPGSAQLNDEWVMRKVHTVEMTHHSSLALRVKADALGLQEEEFGFASGHLAICGGGFPLFTKGEFVGIAIVSGLPHEEDHLLITETLSEYRNEKKW